MSVEKLLLTIPNMSRLQYSDEPIFRIAFPKDAVQYSRSWMYLLRASHFPNGELGFKYFTPELVAAIGHRNNFIYVTPVFTLSTEVHLQQLCDQIVTATGHQVIVKKIETQPLEKFTPASKTDSPTEDESSSETILQLQRLFITPNGTLNPAAKRLARKERAFEPIGSAFTITTSLADIPLNKIEHFLKMDSGKFAAYMPLIRYLHTKPTVPPEYKVMTFQDNDHIRGIYLAEMLSMTDLGFYCGVTSRDEPGITEWMDVYFFRDMFLGGIRTVHLGGAERDGIEHYIKKLLPSRSPYLTQAILYSPSQSSDDTISIRLATESDFKPLAKLYRHVYNSFDNLDEHWTYDSAHQFIAYFYRRQPDLFFVAEHNNQIVGGAVAGIQPWWDGNHLVEGELFIDTHFEKLGTSKELLKALVSKARTEYNAVAWDTIMPTINDHPLGKYERVGFKEVPYWKAISGDTLTLLNQLGA